MIGVSRTYTKDQLMHPLYQAVCNHFLTSVNSFWWVSKIAFLDASFDRILSHNLHRVMNGKNQLLLHKRTRALHLELALEQKPSHCTEVRDTST